MDRGLGIAAGDCGARHSCAPTVTRTRRRSNRAARDAVVIRFNPPVGQAAPGQSVVLYRGDEVLGGGLSAGQPEAAAAVPPTPEQVVIGILAVVLGCLAVTGRHTRRGRRGTGCISSARSAAWRSSRALSGNGCFRRPPQWRVTGAAASSSAPGPWDAGVSLPLIGIRVTPVAIVGLLVAAVGLSLVLLFERIPSTVRAKAPTPASRLEDDDSV